MAPFIKALPHSVTSNEKLNRKYCIPSYIYISGTINRMRIDAIVLHYTYSFCTMDDKPFIRKEETRIVG